MSEATKRRLLEYFVLGVPAYRLRFRSSVSLEATERFFRLCRRVLALAEECQQPFAGRIECDEAMFGGKRKGKRGWGAAVKVLVFGILQRNGRVKVFAVEGRGRDELLPLISEHTTPGSLYYTDDWQANASLAVRGEHVVVTKEKGVPISTALKASGVMLSIGSISTEECRKSSFTFTWRKLLFASTTMIGTYSP